MQLMETLGMGITDALQQITVAMVGVESQLKPFFEELERCLKSNGKILIFGNGGSAADAQHIAAELIGRFRRERRALPAIALTTDSSVLTAWANDYEYDSIFARQIEGLGRQGDVAWGISTSGNSRNVVLAMEKAKELGLRTAALTGHDGGAVKALCDVSITVPLYDTPRIQEAHLIIYHHVCEYLDRVFSI